MVGREGGKEKENLSLPLTLSALLTFLVPFKSCANFDSLQSFEY